MGFSRHRKDSKYIQDKGEETHRTVPSPSDILVVLFGLIPHGVAPQQSSATLQALSQSYIFRLEFGLF